MKHLLIILLVALSVTTFAQNRVNYSQYMHNHQIFNPAYVTDVKDFGGSVFYRNQWMGMVGAPTSFIGNLFYTHGRSSFNAQVLYDEITIFSHLEAGLSYNYAIRLGMATRMTFGIKASYNQQTSDYDQLSYFDADDPNLTGIIKTQGVNFGTGIFFRNRNWHAGLGAPYLFNNANIDNSTELYNDVSYQHFFLTGGYSVYQSDDFNFYPTALVKWTKGAPLSASVDLNCLFKDLIWGSVGYRTGNTVIMSAGLILWDNFKIIYSYDLGLGKVSRFGGMTHEISLGYGMEMFSNPFTKRKFINRRGDRMRNKKSRWR